MGLMRRLQEAGLVPGSPPSSSDKPGTESENEDDELEEERPPLRLLVERPHRRPRSSCSDPFLAFTEDEEPERLAA